MKARPILFNGDMVRALLDGRKMQTRRVVKPQPAGAWAAPGRSSCPFGLRGDLLWVREKWDFRPWGSSGWVNVAYAADGYTDTRECPMNWHPMLYNYQRWRPSIHMPRWASRLTLLITDVRVQRLQDISQEDARAEGISEIKGDGPNLWCADWNGGSLNHPTAIGAFQMYWLHAIDNSWHLNPWVWAISFEVIHKNVNEVMG